LPEITPGFETGNYRMFCALNHFLIKDLDSDYFFGPLGFTNKFEYLPNYFFSEKVIRQIGYFECNHFAKYPFCFCADNSYKTLQNPPAITIPLNVQLIDLEVFLQLLWLIKDNSVNHYTMFAFSDENKVHYLRRSNFFSNCKGLFEDVEFSREELDKVKIYYEKLVEISSKKLSVDQESIFEKSGLGPSINQFEIYNSNNRIERAIFFLGTARSANTIPLRISFYVAILECLFTTDSSGLSHKIAERCALYIGGEAKLQKENFDRIKKAYAFRTKFFHGQNLEKSHAPLEIQILISTELDNLLRQVLNKVIMDDCDIFLQTNQQVLEEWFNSLIFKISEAK